MARAQTAAKPEVIFPESFQLLVAKFKLGTAAVHAIVGRRESHLRKSSDGKIMHYFRSKFVE
jgi:hypothetical protein